MVRLKYAKLLTLLVFLVNVILFFYTWKWFASEASDHASSVASKTLNERNKAKGRTHSTNKHIKKAITVIFRDFYHFENDLQHSIESILNPIPNIQVMVIFESEPYPPLSFVSNFTAIHTNVKFINLNFDIRKTSKALAPLLQIRTKYVLFVADSFRFGGRSIIQKMLGEIEKTSSPATDPITEAKRYDLDVGSLDQNVIHNDHNKIVTNNDKSKLPAKSPNKKVVIIPFASNVKTMSNCCLLNIDIANWTMEYSVINNTQHCDMFLQKHAILVDTSLLKIMPNTLAAPFPEMFYIQAKIFKAELHFLETGFLQDGKRLFTAFHNKQRRKEIRKQQFRQMYKILQVKKVARKYAGKSMKKFDRHSKQHEKIPLNPIPIETIVFSNKSLPLLTSVEYFGCEKNTRSCIGTVFDRVPFYIYLKRNTPPCCLENLKTVFAHVLEELENVGIRYWLDNLALKSAVESSQLDSRAYEIDISFNSFDLNRSTFLKKAQTRPIIDSSGFYWIKATDGQYFRVQYSKQNQIGVNLLPFSMIEGRVRANGFFGWKAKEFSAEFLHPMSTVIFLNKNVMSPNNVRDFLDLKNVY